MLNFINEDLFGNFDGVDSPEWQRLSFPFWQERKHVSESEAYIIYFKMYLMSEDCNLNPSPV